MNTMQRLVFCGLVMISVPMLQGCFHDGYYCYGDRVATHDGDDWHHHPPGWGWGHDGWRHGGGDDECRKAYGVMRPGIESGLSGPVERLANAYHLRESTAQKVIDLARGHERAKVANEMGVSLTELAPLLRLRMPSEDVVLRMAAALNEPVENIEALMQGFISDIRAERDQQGRPPTAS